MTLNRRQFLGGGLAGASLVLGVGEQFASTGTAGAATRSEHKKVLEAGSLPFPGHAPGTDQVPQIEHFVVVMMENHSFDNILGLIGRGDGFTLGSNGQPTAKNPDGHGNEVHAFHMPTECQTDGVGNDWKVAHEAYDGGSCQGFVTSTTPEAMGYFTKADLPFSCGMASVFPIADRYFCSAMAQTDPNRRYLIAGTSLGLINDTFPSELPPNGVIFEQFNKHGISWKDYYSNLPTLGVFLPLLAEPALRSGVVKIDQFFEDAAAGTLPVVQPGGAQLRPPVRRKPTGRPVRGPVREHGGQCGDVQSELAEDDADLDVRRARRLLRPRAAAIRRTPGRHSRPRWDRATLPEASTGTDSGFRAPWSARTPRRTTCPTRSTTTPRSSRPSRRNGTSPRSPAVTRTPTACSTWWMFTRSRRS